MEDTEVLAFRRVMLIFAGRVVNDTIMNCNTIKTQIYAIYVSYIYAFEYKGVDVEKGFNLIFYFSQRFA